MTANQDDAAEVVARAIEAYLVRYPSAADTLEGVATVWLQQVHRFAPMEVVEAALARLANRGVVEIRRTQTGAVIFGLRRSF